VNWTREGINAVRHQNIVFYELLKHLPWAAVDEREQQHNPDWDPRGLAVKAHLIAMVLAQLAGARSLRDIETNLKSHASKLYHLGGDRAAQDTGKLRIVPTDSPGSIRLFPYGS
jgi:hypothetical protein